MIKHIHTTGVIFLVASFSMHWSGHSHAAATGNLGVSASVMEHCRVDFSEGSADYFQSCSSIEVKASGTASNVLGELTAVDASADPYYLDRDPDSQGIASNGQNTLALAERRRRAPKVVTINY